MGKSLSHERSSFSVYSKVVLLALSLVLISLYLYPYFYSLPQPLVSLSSLTWKACFPDAESQRCDWFSVKVPQDISIKSYPKFRGVVNYETDFPTPDLCLLDPSGCRLFISEVGDAAQIRLNGQSLEQHGKFPPHGRYAKHYPANISLPASMLRRQGLNRLEILVYSFKNVQSGLRKSPVGIYKSEDAFRLNRVQIAQTIIIPLVSAGLLLLLAIAAGTWLFFRRESNREIRSFVNFCAALSFFLFSFSELPREFIPVHWAGLIHHTARLLGDLCFIEMLRECFFSDSKWLRRTRILYILVLAICPITTLISWLQGTMDFDVFDTTYMVRKMAFPLLLLPHLIGIWGAYLLPLSKTRWMLLFIFSLTALLQINDSLIFHAWISGTYYVKAYPVLIAIGMGYLIFEREAKKLIQEKLKLETKAAVGAMASQFAHDIRSPLMALRIAETQIQNLPEDVKLLFRSAIGRIQNIAHDLLAHSRRQSFLTAKVKSGFATHISSALSSIVAEKKLQFSRRPEIFIDWEDVKNSENIFVAADPTELKRAVSNLMNNSEESISNAGFIRVRWYLEGENIIISIEDSGSGMTSDLIKRIEQGGASFGKENGFGMGLSHARKFCDQAGGSLKIKSKMGSGTEVQIKLKKSEPPQWMAQSLIFEADSQIVIVDDDETVHRAWRNRLATILVDYPSLSVLYFHDLNLFKKWANDSNLQSTYFLIDHDFPGSEANGLDIIEQLKLGSRAVLVTGIEDDWSLLEKCSSLGIRMAPKRIIQTITIQIVPSIKGMGEKVR